MFLIKILKMIPNIKLNDMCILKKKTTYFDCPGLTLSGCIEFKKKKYKHKYL